MLENHYRIGDFVSTAQVFTPHPEQGKHENCHAKKEGEFKMVLFSPFRAKNTPVQL